MERCDSVLATLTNQLVASFDIKRIGDYCLIETPFLYPDSRIVTILVTELEDGTLELSDDGYAHLYARSSGVSDQVLKATGNELSKRFPGVVSEHGEVLAAAQPDALMNTVVALIESTQGIASLVERRRIGNTSTRLDRQITRYLVNNQRNYERKAKVIAGGRSVDVDYNVLPTERYEQLSLFAWGERLGIRTAESMAWRIEQIRNNAPLPGFTNRVVLLRDDATMFSGRGEAWQRISDTLRDTGAEIISINDVNRVTKALAS